MPSDEDIVKREVALDLGDSYEDDDEQENMNSLPQREPHGNNHTKPVSNKS